MEQVHGVDVSWMTQGSPKDKILSKSPTTPRTPAPSQARKTPDASVKPSTSTPSPNAATSNSQTNGKSEPRPINGTSTGRRPSRSGSIDRQNSAAGSPGQQRRNSWFSNISAKLSGSSSSPPSQTGGQEAPATPPAHNEQAQPNPISLQPGGPEPSVPKPNPSRNAVLQPASKHEGTGPYTPAPPKSGQAGLLGVLRRLSSSGGSAGGLNSKMGHGLVERKVLNVDQNRERCPISELKGAKLRRVSFCVDVEIAPMPKYTDGEALPTPIDKSQKKKLTEKGEGEALKNPKAIEEQKEAEGTIQSTGEIVPKEPVHEGSPGGTDGSTEANIPVEVPAASLEKDSTKKKEKKKKSEEERKARKEKRRKLAEDNGSIPVEIRYDTTDSSSDSPGVNTPKTSSSPTINPVRIYRRCCQLRETPILKKITEQLSDSSNSSAVTGIVNKLDLTGYWLQLPDLITLGDYLSVVPVREIILENSGIGDEGLRVVLAGLLAAKRPENRRKKPKHELEDQGGVVERVVLKNNKLGPDGWKHISLFLYLCRSLKYLDISHIPFPRQAPSAANGVLPNGVNIPRTISDIFAKAIAERLGGSRLEVLNMGETEPSMEQLGAIIDGIIKCGVGRLSIAHNHLDEHGVGHVARYISSGKCEGLDLGGNDIAGHIETIVEALKENSILWAVSLAGCNLTPSSLCKVLPALVNQGNFRFIDLSHNHELFQCTPSAVGVLRRYLPKMESLKRIHLQDVNMTAEEAIAIVEVLPEVRHLAHINMLGNVEIAHLADAITEEAQEEACALYASLMAAARISKSIVCVDIEVPGEKAGEIVKAMAKQVVAYCLRNMEQIPDTNIGSALASVISETQTETAESKPAAYPGVLAHLVGHDVMEQSDGEDGDSPPPDEDYVIGGTGVVKALTFCLKNRGDESRRQSGEFIREENGTASPLPRLPTGGKAKDMSKHLLAAARKIRLRLQPALEKARANPTDEQDLRKLVFLDETLQGIIKRFEDEYPDTREAHQHHATSNTSPKKNSIDELSTSPPPVDDSAIAVSEGEDESEIHPPKPLSRSNSMLSRTLAEEEGRVHRVGHRFRSGFLRQEHLDLINTIDDINADPKHMRVLSDMAEDLGGELLEKVKEKGVMRALKEDKELLYRSMRDSDPDYFDRFLESQRKARANINLPGAEKGVEGSQGSNESAIAD